MTKTSPAEWILLGSFCWLVHWVEVTYCFSGMYGVFNFCAGAFPDVVVFVYDQNSFCEVDFSHVECVELWFQRFEGDAVGRFVRWFLSAACDAEDYVSLKRFGELRSCKVVSEFR